MAAPDSKRSIGTGVMRSSSSSSVSPPASPMEPFAFGEGPYVHASSRAMRDLTKAALGTASLGRRHHTQHQAVTDTFGWVSATPDRPWMQRNGNETHTAKRWRVDDRGWMVGSKPDSSPKVLRTAQTVAPPGPRDGSHLVIANNVPRNFNHIRDFTVAKPSPGEFASYESPKVARGRVLGSTKEYIPLSTVAAEEYAGDIVEAPWSSTADTLTDAQVEAYKHYEDKARRSSLREYKPGFAPRRLSSQEAKVADAGWEAKNNRQLGKIGRLCDELYEAYSTGQRTGCGAEDVEDERSTPGDLLLGMRPLEKESSIERRRPMFLPYPSTGHSIPSSPTKEQYNSPQRPPLAIHRKPVSSSSSMNLTQQSITLVLPSANPTNVHTRASSSPAIHQPLDPSLSNLRAAQLRSKSSSPPKRNISARLLPLEPTRIGWGLQGDTLPCTFPLSPALTTQENVWKEAHSLRAMRTTPDGNGDETFTGTVRRRRSAKAGLKKWATLETVPLPLMFTMPQVASYPRASSTTFSMAKYAVDEPSLEGPELLYPPPPSHDPRDAVTLELHPYFSVAALHVHRWGLRAMKQRGWVIWAVKVSMLLWVAVILWTLLDAVRESMRRVLWPATIMWDLGVWIVGG